MAINPTPPNKTMRPTTGTVENPPPVVGSAPTPVPTPVDVVSPVGFDGVEVDVVVASSVVVVAAGVVVVDEVLVVTPVVVVLSAVAVGGAVVEVLVVAVVVVVVFFRRVAALEESEPSPQTHAVQSWPSAQSVAVSHCSPAAASTQPSPQLDARASKRRWPLARALNVPVKELQEVSSTLVFIRMPRRVPHAAQRARSVACRPRRWIRACTGEQPLAMVTMPSASTTIASNGRADPGTRGGATRKRTPGQGGGATAVADAGAATSTQARAATDRAILVEVLTVDARRCATRRTVVAPSRRRIVPCASRELVADPRAMDVGSMSAGAEVQTTDRPVISSNVGSERPRAPAGPGSPGRGRHSRLSPWRSSN